MNHVLITNNYFFMWYHLIVQNPVNVNSLFVFINMRHKPFYIFGHSDVSCSTSFMQIPVINELKHVLQVINSFDNGSQ